MTNEDDGDELGNDDFLLEDTISQPEGEVIEECHDIPSEDAPKVIASDFVSKPILKDAPRERGEAALRDEATSPQHLMCHTPKNPFCETCNRAKMYNIHLDRREVPLKLRPRSLVITLRRTILLHQTIAKSALINLELHLLFEMLPLTSVMFTQQHGKPLINV